MQRASALGPLGILGGGQLGRMTAEAASRLGVDVVVAERFQRSPAARIAAHEVVFPGATWDDDDAIERFADLAPVVTLENEFVDAGVLRKIEARGSRVWPGPTSVGTVQDKLRQKHALAQAGLPVPPFRRVEEPGDLLHLAGELGWPLMLKARRDGYDGSGNVLVANDAGSVEACRKLGWPERTLYVERQVRFLRELAVIVVRGRDGQSVVYPVVETRQDPLLHVCRMVLAPAPVDPVIAREAARVAKAAIEAMDGVGAWGVELFLLEDGSLSVNELAPRPHNSGHYSIEGCVTSQFENHVRAVLGLPLGEPTLVAPAVGMVNLLGQGAPCVSTGGLERALRIPGAHVHLYGKHESRPGRKMGHVTATGQSLEDAMDRAQRAANALPI
ncbi:MAG: 5-(carboxyamino)imidazole ribonucleotide synthase [Chloroflexi bacterium]|nr:5-(carboxyamino)imidazole ribonucleotide synthase [Chloroflexota bacterium]